MKDILYFNTLEDIKLTDMMRVSKKKEHDYSIDYLTFEALEDGTFTLSIPASVNSYYMTSVSYSTDNGETWTTTNVDSTAQTITTPTITQGNKVLWKGVGKQMASSTSTSRYSQFSSMGNFNASGNIMSLLYGDEFINHAEFSPGSTYNFCYLFNNNKLISVENLILPATESVDRCYQNMFQGCTGLTIAPALPATTLGAQCYYGMFKDCTSLTIAPVLPATTLAYECYHSMFRGCTSLTTAPELPAITLVSGCYSNMFHSCTILNYIKAMFTTTPGAGYVVSWVYKVAETGTFVKNANATWTTTGVNGIPTGWTVETADA